MSNKNQYLGEAVPLDEDQKRFCEADGQLIRLLAPAGCGKTHSLLWRCLFKLSKTKDEKPKFLVFTFTRAARDELMDRLRSDEHFHDLRECTRVSTLNSWGYQRVKKTAHNLQLITNQAQKYNCVNNVLQPVWRRHPQVNKLLDDSYRRASVSKELIDAIDTLKSMAFRHDMYSKGALTYIDNHLIWLNQCGMARNYNALLKKMLELEFIDNTGEEQIKLLFDFWAQSCEHLYQCAYFTLEDQKYWAWIELEQTLEKTGKVTGAARYHHIVVDEFQDINPLDLQLLKTIVAHNNATLTIIGDEDQAIFEWRGATPSFILNPDKYFGTKSKTFILGTNYRSPRNIISYSQQLIRNNRRRENKKVVANQVGNAKIEVIRNENITQSIEFILDYINNWRNGSFANSIAIVGRKRSQIIPFQIVFAGCDIQFYAAEDLQVFLSDAFNELKDMLSIKARARHDYVGMDPVDDLLKLCDKVKRFPVKKDDKAALRRYFVDKKPANLIDAAKMLLEYSGPLKGPNKGSSMSISFLSVIVDLLRAETVSESIVAISKGFEGLQKNYGKSIDDIFYADPPFIHLSDLAKRYGSDYAAFYSDINKATAKLAKVLPIEEDDMVNTDWKCPLHLMTAIRTKGKEFDTVIVLDANDGIWPNRLANGEEALEQERRVFYVATTRARQHLIYLVNETILDEPVAPTPYLEEMRLL